MRVLCVFVPDTDLTVSVFFNTMNVDRARNQLEAGIEQVKFNF